MTDSSLSTLESTPTTPSPLSFSLQSPLSPHQSTRNMARTITRPTMVTTASTKRPRKTPAKKQPKKQPRKTPAKKGPRKIAGKTIHQTTGGKTLKSLRLAVQKRRFKPGSKF